MKITLLAPLPDPTRWSMDLYSQSLKAAMDPLLQPGERVDLFPDEGNLFRCKGHVSKLHRYWQHYFQYGSAVRNLQSDIFHITDHGYANLIPSLHGQKIIVSFHDALLPRLGRGDIPVTHKPTKTILAQKYALGCMRKADVILAASEFSRREFHHFCAFPEASTQTIHYGIKENPRQAVDRAAARTKWGLENEKALLVVGRTDAHKNMEGTLRILEKLVTERGQNVVLLKVGSDFSPGQKKMISKLKMETCVRSLGVLSEEDLQLAYGASDALLFLSWYEGFGFPALEAMQADLPVVISNRASLPEIAGEAAMIVDPENETAATARIAELLHSSKLKQKLITRGREQVKKFSWEKTARQTLEVYRQVFSSNQKGMKVR